MVHSETKAIVRVGKKREKRKRKITEVVQGVPESVGKLLAVDLSLVLFHPPSLPADHHKVFTENPARLIVSCSEFLHHSTSQWPDKCQENAEDRSCIQILPSPPLTAIHIVKYCLLKTPIMDWAVGLGDSTCKINLSPRTPSLWRRHNPLSNLNY